MIFTLGKTMHRAGMCFDVLQLRRFGYGRTGWKFMAMNIHTLTTSDMFSVYGLEMGCASNASYEMRDTSLTIHFCCKRVIHCIPDTTVSEPPVPNFHCAFTLEAISLQIHAGHENRSKDSHSFRGTTGEHCMLSPSCASLNVTGSADVQA